VLSVEGLARFGQKDKSFLYIAFKKKKKEEKEECGRWEGLKEKPAMSLRTSGLYSVYMVSNRALKG